MTYQPPYTQIGYFMGVKQSTVTWIATWLRALAVLFSLPGSAMGRETVYPCYDLRRFSKAGEIWT